MSQYGEGVSEPYAYGGFISLTIDEPYAARTRVDLHPDEARLLGLRLLKMADEADNQGY